MDDKLKKLPVIIPGASYAKTGFTTTGKDGAVEEVYVRTYHLPDTDNIAKPISECVSESEVPKWVREKLEKEG